MLHFFSNNMLTLKKFTETRDDELMISIIVIFLEFHSTKLGLPLVDSWSRGLD